MMKLRSRCSRADCETVDLVAAAAVEQPPTLVEEFSQDVLAAAEIVTEAVVEAVSNPLSTAEAVSDSIVASTDMATEGGAFRLETDCLTD